MALGHAKGVSRTGRSIGGIDENSAKLLRARTTAMVNMIDVAIGEIIKTLDDTGLRENTIIVFSADHGDGLGDHGIWGKGPWSYRSIIETPLLINGPGIAQGKSEAVISDVDLAPSICALMEAPMMPFANGLDLSAHFADPSQPTREFALMEYRNGFRENDYASAALVGAELTYVRYQDGIEELTDLSTDPEEQRNVASEQPERCAKLRTELLDTLLRSQSKGPHQHSHA